MQKLLLDINEAASALSISRSAIYELLADGSIQSIKLGKSRRIIAASLQTFIDSLTGKDN